jgi:hypothetical protein
MQGGFLEAARKWITFYNTVRPHEGAGANVSQRFCEEKQHENSS